MFLYKNLFFSISSVISIPIMLIGINGGYFPAICRVCFRLAKVGFKNFAKVWRCLIGSFDCVAISTDAQIKYVYVYELFL